jgi:hypothetical protein
VQIGHPTHSVHQSIKQKILVVQILHNKTKHALMLKHPWWMVIPTSIAKNEMVNLLVSKLHRDTKSCTDAPLKSSFLRKFQQMANPFWKVDNMHQKTYEPKRACDSAASPAGVTSNGWCHEAPRNAKAAGSWLSPACRLPKTSPLDPEHLH